MGALAEITETFTRSCKTGIIDPSLPKQTEIYHHLVKDNINTVLKKAFPLTFHLLSPDNWDPLVTSFLKTEPLPSPFLWQMPKSFATFIKGQSDKVKLIYPYLDDLLAFEWLEIELCMMPDLPPPIPQKGVLHLNPESRLVSYHYPVFDKKPLPREMVKKNYFLLGFRHPESGKAHFVALSPFYHAVLEILRVEPQAGEEVLTLVAEAFQIDSSQILEKGKSFLLELVKMQALYQPEF